jgi:hypothetical protein
MSRQTDTDRFYELMDVLSSSSGGARQLREATRSTGWPPQGVYFFFEQDEFRRNGRPRVVRVGTHALRPMSKATLWKRLSQHRGYVRGRHPGSGNHRGSIFRLHVGAALINRGDVGQVPLAAWLSHEPWPDHREAELRVERAVSDYIGRMHLLWVAVPTRNDGTSDRGLIEANSIALLSVAAGSCELASPGWLGHHAPSSAVGSSGLWNVRHIADEYSPKALDVVKTYVEAHPGQAS